MSSLKRDVAEYFGEVCKDCKHFGRKEWEERLKCSKCKAAMIRYYVERFGNDYID